MRNGQHYAKTTGSSLTINMF